MIFKQVLDEIHDVALSKKPSELVRFVLTRTGIESAARKNSEEEEKLENMRELASVARTYDNLPIGEARRIASIKCGSGH